MKNWLSVGTDTICIVYALAALFALSTAPAAAQENEPTVPETAAGSVDEEVAKTLSAAEIAARADAVAAALLQVQQDLDSGSPDTGSIPEGIDELTAHLDELQPSLAIGQVEELSQSDIERIVQILRRMSGQLNSWHDKLQRFADLVDEDDRKVKTQLDYFQSVLDNEASDELPDAVLERVAAVMDSLDGARDQVRAQLDATLAQLARVSSLQVRITEAGDAIRANEQRRERDVLTFDREPIWEMERVKESLPPLVMKDVQSRLNSVAEYETANRELLIVAVIILAALLGVAFYTRPAIIELSRERDIDLAQKPFLERPISLVLLLWAVLVPWLILPEVPVALGIVRLAIVVIALWRMLPVIAPEIEHASIAGLLALTLLSGVLLVVQQSDLSDRLVLLGVSAAGIFLLRRLSKSTRTETVQAPTIWWRFGKIFIAVVPYVLMVCIFAVVIGAVAFAQQTVDGVLLLFTLLLAIIVIEDALNTAVHFFITGTGQSWLRSIRRYPDLARRRFALLIRLLLLAVFLTTLPRIFPLMSILFGWVVDLLTVDITVGTVEMSAADVLSLIAGVVIAIMIARFTRFTLDEDVFPHLPIATGAAAAASRLIYYTLIAGGILFALAAGGVELNKLTLVIGALGVGIGFGLQGIVNNFVSGLVLAFERPFQVGDIIAVGTLTGRVREIGLRASRVRTFDGAEVIVPNADLIAGNVINWTLSDRMRRLDVKIGVAYGSDPGQVRKILREIAEKNGDVAKDPEPAALFDNFGDSSLDFTLRAWIPEAGDWPQITSDLNESINAALAEAGIEIPFPQRTLHIRSDERSD